MSRIGAGDSRISEPVQQRAQETRDKLIEAALERFATIGYDAATTRDIETAAGVKRGLIVYHFKTKDVLWKSAVDWLFAQARDALDEAALEATEEDTVGRLRSFVRGYVRFCARFPAVNRLMVQEGMRDDWRLAWMIERFVKHWYRRVAATCEQAQGAGLVPPMAPVHFYYILTGGAALMFSMAPEARQLARVDPSDPSTIEAHADALAALLFPRFEQGS